MMPFEAAQQALFFGRDAEVRDVVERVRTEPLLVVAGDAGVGKTSLIAAGVAPAIVQRIERALPYVKAENVILAPDCGMKYLPREVADGKMRAMVEGAAIVRRELAGAAS